MKETRADTRTALLQALGLHLVLFALMFAGLSWMRSPIAEAAQGDVIEADLVDPSALSASMRSALQRAPQPPQPPAVEQPVVEPDPEPLPQPIAEDTPPPPPVPDPQPVEQDRVQRDADSPDVAKATQEQDEKRKPPEQADFEAQRQRVLAEIRRQRELAAKERTMAEQKAQQLADARAAQVSATAPPRGNPNSRSSNQAAYIVALQDAILRQWTRPESVGLDEVCQVLIRQIPGGEVVSVEISPSCPYDALGRRSVEAAILKASPLPYAGFEDEFIRDPVLKFRARDAIDR